MAEYTEFEAAGGVLLRVIAGGGGIRAIQFSPRGEAGCPRNDSNPLLVRAVAELREYFAGARCQFSLPLEMQGTDFQLRVWKVLEGIPYGETRSYAQVAQALGQPRAVRAVGAANGRNPVPILVPCHRVIGAGGQLVGYGGGLPIKKLLLELESQSSARAASAE
jgi:methylated-DNA-[protein]-cysteine S-methyltransferase